MMPLQIDERDLVIEFCPKCQGRKRVEQTTRSSHHSSYTQEIDCMECEGRGLKLTPVGAKLFDFVKEASRFTGY
jgi:hypothetical protein